MLRTPEAGSPVANASRGGDMAFPEIPAELVEATAYFAAKLPDVPFYCVDYLYDGERYWFGELEPDGVIAPDWSRPRPHPPARRHPRPLDRLPQRPRPLLGGHR